MQLSRNALLTLAKASQVEAGTAVEGDAIDMQNWDGVLFFITIAKFNAANYIKVQQSSDDAAADPYADLEGSKVAATVNGQVVGVDVYRPRERYVKAYIERGGLDTATGDLYAVRYSGRKAPADNVEAGVRVLASLVSPAEGTA